MCFATTLVSVSLRGGQPTGRIAFAVTLRISVVASARRKICTRCPASASTKPCANGNAALVGSSGPHAPFIMMFSGFSDSSALVLSARNGRAANCARNLRLAIVCPPRLELSISKSDATLLPFRATVHATSPWKVCNNNAERVQWCRNRQTPRRAGDAVAGSRDRAPFPSSFCGTRSNRSASLGQSRPLPLALAFAQPLNLR